MFNTIRCLPRRLYLRIYDDTLLTISYTISVDMPFFSSSRCLSISNLFKRSGPVPNGD